MTKKTVSLWLILTPLLVAQQPNVSGVARGKKDLDAAHSASIPLTTTITVQDNVNVEAVLLPQPIASMVFGKSIANNYAVVEVNISNRSDDAALIIQSVYMDYCEWALSGLSGKCGENQRKLNSWETGTDSTKVASVESRIARGQLLQAQTWTTRNWVIRAMKAAGAAAAGYAFPFSSDVIRGINAWNGAIIPGAEAFWPDSTVAQLDRISDYGFTNNKVVPQQAADIVIAFFPIDRFLTPGFKRVFLKSPALFFNPSELALDPRAQNDPDVKMIFDDNFGGHDKAAAAIAELRKNLVLADGQQKTNVYDLAGFLKKLSLNKIRLVVTGIMTVDTDSVPATIDSVTCDPDINSPDVWAVTGIHTCTIHGTHLSNGEPKLTEATRLGISEVTVAKDGSSDKALQFTFKLAGGVNSPDTLKLRVTKTGKNKQVTDSMEFSQAFRYDLAAPTVTQVTIEDGTGKVTGTGFYDNPGNTFQAALRPDGAKDIPLKVTNRTGQTLDFSGSDISPAGCYAVVVTVGKLTAVSRDQVFLPPPQIASASVAAGTVTIGGARLDAPESCGKLAIEAGDDQTPQHWEPVLEPRRTATKITATMPSAKGTAKWIKVRLKLGDAVTTADLK